MYVNIAARHPSRSVAAIGALDETTMDGDVSSVAAVRKTAVVFR